MVQSLIKMDEYEDRVLNMIKAKQGFKNKSEAVAFAVRMYGENFLEPELRPEFIEKIKLIEKKGKFTNYKNIQQLRAEIENA